MAFLESSSFDESQTPPERKLIIALCRTIGRLMAALPGNGIADRFVPCFLDAGLGEPQILREAPVVGSPELFLQWGVATYKAFLPTMERLGIVDPAIGDPETLIERLLVEAQRSFGPVRDANLCGRLGHQTALIQSVRPHIAMTTLGSGNKLAARRSACALQARFCLHFSKWRLDRLGGEREVVPALPNCGLSLSWDSRHVACRQAPSLPG